MTAQGLKQWCYTLSDDTLARQIVSYRNKRDAFRPGREPRDVMRTLGILLREQDRRREARH